MLQPFINNLQQNLCFKANVYNMDANVELAVQSSESNGRICVIAVRTKYSSNIFNKKDGIIVITEPTLDVYNIDNCELQYSIKWIKLKHISKNKDSFKLAFDSKSFTIETKDSSPLFGSVCHVLLQTCTRNEINEVGLNKFKFGNYAYSGYGVLVRLNQLCSIRKQNISIYDMALIRKTLMFRQPFFDISNFEDKSTVVRYILDILPLCDDIEYVCIPKIASVDTFALVSEYSSHFNRVNFLQIQGNCKTQINTVFDRFKKNKSLSCLSIINHKFTEKTLSSLSNYIEQSKLPSLELSHSLSNEILPYFYQKFFTVSIQQSLGSLSLDNILGISIPNLFPNIPNVLQLSLENCGLSIEDILIGAEKLRSLRLLNVSKNSCGKLNHSTVILPPALTTIYANNVSWGETCLQSFFKLMFQRNEYGIQIGISKINASVNEWDRVFQELKRISFTALLGLTWDGNRVSEQFFDFLSRQECLSFLSMNNIFNENMLEHVTLFSNIIHILSNLNVLSIKGGNECQLRSSISPIIRAINGTRIHTLDISNNNIGDQGLNQVRSLYYGTSLEIIDFDGSCPTKIDSFIDLMEVASKEQNRVKTSFPVSDFEKLQAIYDDKTIFKSIVSKFQKPPKQMNTKSSEIKFPTESSFFQQFYIYKYFAPPEIPLYYKREDVQRMRRIGPKSFANLVSLSNRNSLRPSTMVQNATAMVIGSNRNLEKNNRNMQLEPVSTPIPNEMFEKSTNSDDEIYNSAVNTINSDDKFYESSIKRQNVHDHLRENLGTYKYPSSKKLSPPKIHPNATDTRAVPKNPIIRKSLFSSQYELDEKSSTVTYNTNDSVKTSLQSAYDIDKPDCIIEPPKSNTVDDDNDNEIEINLNRSDFSMILEPKLPSHFSVDKAVDLSGESEDYYEEEEERSSTKTTTGTYSSRIPFQNKYEYYTDDGYYDEDSFSTAPGNSSLNTQTPPSPTKALNKDFNNYALYAESDDNDTFDEPINNYNRFTTSSTATVPIRPPPLASPQSETYATTNNRNDFKTEYSYSSEEDQGDYDSDGIHKSSSKRNYPSHLASNKSLSEPRNIQSLHKTHSKTRKSAKQDLSSKEEIKKSRSGLRTSSKIHRPIPRDLENDVSVYVSDRNRIGNINVSSMPIQNQSFYGSRVKKSDSSSKYDTSSDRTTLHLRDLESDLSSKNEEKEYSVEAKNEIKDAKLSSMISSKNKGISETRSSKVFGSRVGKSSSNQTEIKIEPSSEALVSGGSNKKESIIKTKVEKPSDVYSFSGARVSKKNDVISDIGSKKGLIDSITNISGKRTGNKTEKRSDNEQKLYKSRNELISGSRLKEDDKDKSERSRKRNHKGANTSGLKAQTSTSVSNASESKIVKIDNEYEYAYEYEYE